MNNYTDEDIAYLTDQEELDYRYLIIGYEKAPTTGTPHLQGFIYFDTQRSKKSIIKKLPGCHIEKQRGTFTQAMKYSMKEDDYTEIGEIPQQGHLNKQDIEEIMSNPYSNFKLYTQYRKSYNEVKNQERHQKDPQLYVISDTHKYIIAKEYKPEEVSIYPSEYDGEPILITPPYVHDLEAWLNKHPPKYKNGYEYRLFNPEKVYIMYSDQKDYNYIIKKYSDYIDEIPEKAIF